MRQGPDPEQHREPNTANGLDVPVDAEPHDHAMEQDRDEYRLEDEGDGRGDIEVWRI